MSEQENGNVGGENDPVAAAPKVPLTKEQKIAQIDAQIAKLEQRKLDLINGVERPAKAPAKVAALPNVGDVITFKYGRTTATTEPTTKTGTVLAVKVGSKTEDGKSTPTMIRVQVGEGFDTDFATVFPAQIVAPVAEPEAAPTADENADAS